MGEDINRRLDSERRKSSDSKTPLINNQNQENGECCSWIRQCFCSWCCCCSRKPLVRYKKVVCGETFGADEQLLDQIQTSGLNMTNDEESCITIVFCPVTSRTGTDAEAAMEKVPGGDPVILVLMHYSQEPKHISSSKLLSSNPNVVLEINIVYHDKKNGLLGCEQNKNAVLELKEELKKYSRPQSSGSNGENQSNS
ncbi:uncharacterized protein LOC105357202 isoform X2 [Oryzias latipes]|uniref:uncharacterized protein LOC105357202 isoform X2 n=1 Tax=Oryzias latipes TaxID=8090 RepID=UPI0005CBB8CF|nr:uncharacterized protein LOC105357202 isoform X2 [Oryzias latipes]